jgi:hypothetical protein
MLILLMTHNNHSLLIVSEDLDKAQQQIESGLRDIYQSDLRNYLFDIEKQMLRVTWSASAEFPETEDIYRVNHLSAGDLLWVAHTGDSPLNKVTSEKGH